MQLYTKNGQDNKKCSITKLWCSNEGGVQNEGLVLGLQITD